MINKMCYYCILSVTSPFYNDLVGDIKKIMNGLIFNFRVENK